ncbi:MAG: response regulator [Immundisolibacteraceae bacterium]|nr:response regulator [Immundisolibacteraceae bacterium]
MANPVSNLGLNAKLVLFTAAIVTLVGGGISFVSSNTLEQELNNYFNIRSSEISQSTAVALTDPLYFLDIKQIQIELAQALSTEEVQAVYALDNQGRVISNGTDDNPHWLRKLDNPAITKLVSTQQTISEQGPNSLMTGLALLTADQELIGYLVIEYATDKLQLSLRNARQNSLLLTGGFLVFGALLAWVMAWRTTGPLLEITSLLARIDAGHLDEKLPETRTDELGKLASVINAMLDEIRNTTTSLDRLDLEIENHEATEAALHQAVAAAEMASFAKSEFLANMSHEIRTPMNGVLGMTSLLLDTQLDNQQRTQATTIRQSAEYLLSIINDILDFSKIEAGKLDLELVDFGLATLIAELGGSMAIRADEKQLELICPANPISDICYHGDPGRIRQILTNLLSNAIKFTRQGEVTLRCFPEIEKGLLRVEVTDTGIGLTEEHQEKLFKRFSQADASTTRQFGGTGLGLAISKQLAELMDGEIGVTSEVETGSTFWVTLRLSPSQEKPKTLPAVDFGDIKILVVDDNASYRKLIHQLLTGWNIRHDLADSGPAALELLYQAKSQEKPFDIVLLDQQMPGMDGIRLNQLMKEDPLLKQVKRIMVSPIGMAGDFNKLQGIGFNGLLSKPIAQSELLAVIEQVLAATNDNPILITSHSTEQLPQFNARVLVAEDSATNQAVIKGMLKKYGIEANLANDGQEAVSTLERIPYDLVLMDCQMPVLDGLSATRVIRDPDSAVVNHLVPVVAITANAMKDDRDHCLAAGMNDYLTKPVDLDQLTTALRRWLPDHCITSNTPATTANVTSKIKVVNEAESEPPPNPITSIPDFTQLNGTEKIFDQEAMAGRLMDDLDLMRNVAETFLQDMPGIITTINEQAAANDPKQVAIQAHKIKGASSNVGGNALSALARALELAAETGDTHRIQEWVQGVEPQFLQLKTAIQESLL